MSIQTSVPPWLKNGAFLNIYTDDWLPHKEDRPERLIPQDTIATGSFKDNNTLHLQRGEATISIQAATEFLTNYNQDFEDRVEKKMGVGALGDQAHLIIGEHQDAPTLALDVLKKISQSYKAVAVVGSHIYHLSEQKKPKT